MTTPTLCFSDDVVQLTADVCNIESVSGDEKALADAVEAMLRQCDHLTVSRDGDAVIAQTSLGRDTRVIVAGHLDTVPLADHSSGRRNLPTWVTGEGDDQVLHGRGTVDMKGGVAVQLACAVSVAEPVMDVTYIFYDHEEVEAEKNGLLRLATNCPEVLQADFAVLGEPTSGLVEGGCNGTLRVVVDLPGKASHSARAWMGDNAIHKAADILAALRDHEAATVTVDGLAFRESLSAVGIGGGIAGNVIPDLCQVTINYRFAPDKTVADALEYVKSVVGPVAMRITDESPGARPGLYHQAAADFVARTGQEPQAKVGWTDVSRFSAMGTPAINFGPGDPLLAHTADEHVPARHITSCYATMRDWLTGDTAS